MSWKILKMLYLHLLILTYCMERSTRVDTAFKFEIYGNSCTYFNKITALSNKLLRILQNKSYDTRTTDLYRTYCTLPVLKLHEFRVCCAQFVHHKDKLPNVLITILYQTTLFICMILGIKQIYIDTELIHHMAIAV